MIALEPLLLVLSATTIGLLLHAWHARRRLAALDAAQRELVRRLTTVEGDLGAILSCSRTIGQRIGDAERTDRTLQKQIDKLRFHGEDNQVVVEHAMKLLASGQDLADVTRICGLSAGEVEILQNLSRFRPAA